MNASWVTVYGVSFTLLFTILYWFYLLPFKKANRLALITILVGSGALTIVFYNVVDRMGTLGGLLILSFWIIPSCLVWKFQRYFTGIEQRKLIGLQIFRLIGGFFLVEMGRGYIPASFALPAGIGDLLVGLAAAWIFFYYQHTPRWAVLLITGLGLIDFVSAFFFGFTSLPGPAQLFAFGRVNQVNLFPTGIIPIFLVPYATVNHMLAIINLRNAQNCCSKR